MRLLTILILLLLVNNNQCKSQNSDEFRIGKVKNGKFIITEKNTDKVKQNWASVMKTQHKSQIITKMAIESGIDTDSNETYYLITGTNSQHTFTIANEVYLRKDKFYLKTNDASGTVSCSGCDYGCHVQKVRKNWYCSGECGGNCTKNETVSY